MLTEERIAAPLRTRRHPDPQHRVEIIIQLCRMRPLTLRELADLLGRAPDHLRRIVRDLLQADRLAYLYPERPQHPDQRYVAADDDAGAR